MILGHRSRGRGQLRAFADWDIAREYEKRQARPRIDAPPSGGIPCAKLASVLRALSVPAENERGPLFMDQVLSAIHQGNPRKLPITLGILRHAGEVTLTLEFPYQLRGIVEAPIYAHYPEAKLFSLPTESAILLAKTETWTVTVELYRDLYPIRRYTQFEDPLNRQIADPLTTLLTSLVTEPMSGFQSSIHISICPSPNRRIHRMQKCILILAEPWFSKHPVGASVYRHLALSRFWIGRFAGWAFARCLPRSEKLSADLNTSETRHHEREDYLVAANEKAGKLLFATTITLQVSGPSISKEEACSKLREIAAAFGQFNSPRRASFHTGHFRGGQYLRSRKTFLLATDELATLWHPATAGVQAPTMTVVESKEAEPPVRLPTPREHPDLAILGQALFRNKRQTCGLLPDDRRRHLFIEGKTGMGKSTLLHRLLATDIAAGRGVGLIDPHGDLCEGILSAIPSYRTNDIVLFDAADTSYPLAFNILHCPNPSHRALTASGIISAFKKIWGEFFGPRMENVFRNSLLALLEVEGATLVTSRQPFVVNSRLTTLPIQWTSTVSLIRLRKTVNDIAICAPKKIDRHRWPLASCRRPFSSSTLALPIRLPHYPYLCPARNHPLSPVRHRQVRKTIDSSN